MNIKQCCVYCHNRGVGCQMFCTSYKSDYDKLIEINHAKNKVISRGEAERRLLSNGNKKK